MTRLARVVVEAAIIGIVALLVAAMHAEAAVHVRVAADAPHWELPDCGGALP